MIGVEDQVPVPGGHTGAVVEHRHAGRVAAPLHLDGDVGAPVANGVRQEIADDLSHPRRIGDCPNRILAGDPHPLPVIGIEGLGDLSRLGSQENRDARHIEVLRFGLGAREEILDDVGEVPSLSDDPLHHGSSLLGVHPIVVQELGISDDGGQRRLELMGHRIDEVVLEGDLAFGGAQPLQGRFVASDHPL